MTNEGEDRMGQLPPAVASISTDGQGKVPEEGPEAGAPIFLQTPAIDDERTEKAQKIVKEYLLANAPQFRKLHELRQKGWQNSEGDRYFQRQRKNADQADDKLARHFYKMMNDIGKELHNATSVFNMGQTNKPRILDMCMAPGGILRVALDHNQRAETICFTLPESLGGHKVLLPAQDNVTVTFADITMLAADMGVGEIPPDHPDVDRFLPQQPQFQGTFDLVICDGQVLRTHQREPYREYREARRLASTQIALGLERLRPGGTLVMLMHKADSWNAIRVLHTFSEFSRVQTYKPKRAHRTRSSFYMVARNVRSDHPNAVAAVREWKEDWKVATFGTDEELSALRSHGEEKVQEVLKDFGPEVIRLGNPVWRIQTNALAKAPYITGS